MVSLPGERRTFFHEGNCCGCVVARGSLKVARRSPNRGIEDYQLNGGLPRAHDWLKKAISDNIGSVNSVAPGLRFATITGARTRF